MKEEIQLTPKDKRTLLILDEDDLYDFEESREEAAARWNSFIEYPSKNELQVDIDTHLDYDRFKAAIASLPEGLVVSVKEKTSKSGGIHKHITVELKSEFSDLEKIALQFMLGSDYIRESLGALRVLCGIKNPTCFFEKE